MKVFVLNGSTFGIQDKLGVGAGLEATKPTNERVSDLRQNEFLIRHRFVVFPFVKFSFSTFFTSRRISRENGNINYIAVITRREKKSVYGGPLRLND